MIDLSAVLAWMADTPRPTVAAVIGPWIGGAALAVTALGYTAVVSVRGLVRSLRRRKSVPEPRQVTVREELVAALCRTMPAEAAIDLLVRYDATAPDQQAQEVQEVRDPVAAAAVDDFPDPPAAPPDAGQEQARAAFRATCLRQVADARRSRDESRARYFQARLEAREAQWAMEDAQRNPDGVSVPSWAGGEP